MFHHSSTKRLGLLQRFIILQKKKVSERAQERVKSAWRRQGFYKDEASILCHTVLILCSVLEKTEKTDCNVTGSTLRTHVKNKNKHSAAGHLTFDQ